MDLRLMEYFVAVVDHGGITKAAESLYISQPSLSQAIRNLEREVGTTLFDRSQQFSLTPAGHAFNGPARRVLQEVDRAREKVAAVRQIKTGRLTVAATATATMTPLPDVVARLRRHHPGVRVDVSDPGGPAGVIGAVRRGEAEVGMTQFPVKADGLVTRTPWSHRIVLALSRAQAARLPDPVPLEQVRTIPLVLEADDALQSLAIDPDLEEVIGPAVIRCALRPTLWELVSQGAGATLISETLARRVLRNVTLRLTDPEVRRPVGIVYRAAPPSPAARAFISLVDDGTGHASDPDDPPAARSINARAAADKPSASNTSP